MVGVLLAAFGAGLLGSAHCLGMCGGFAASCVRSRGGLPAWHVGRIFSYVILGGVAGFLGTVIPGPAWLPAALAGLLLVWFALALAGLVPEPRLVPPGLARLAGNAAASPGLGAQLLFGVANGFLPCGLVYTALSVPVALGHPLEGAAAMAAFGLGTVPALTAAAFGLRRLVMTTLWRRRLLAALLLAIGLWTIWKRASGLTPNPGHRHSMVAAPGAGAKRMALR